MANPPLPKAGVPERMSEVVRAATRQKNAVVGLKTGTGSGEARGPQVESTGGLDKAQGSRLPKE